MRFILSETGVRGGSRYLIARRAARVFFIVLCAARFALSPAALAQDDAGDLTSQSLEDLMNIHVTSVTQMDQQLSRTAAPVFVVTRTDIQNSAATNIPDLLRMVPGLDVAQINGDTWAISARGFNGRFSNQMLVLVDGRSIYTPTFGGVFWDLLDLPLNDIERIEVILGPGGSTWGANAVNGVINIITKDSAVTKGKYLESGVGNLYRGFGVAQYGAQLGRSTTYRMYADYFNQDHFDGTVDPAGDDGWHMLNGGFRMDTALSHHNTLTVEGSIEAGREGQPQPNISTIATTTIFQNDEVDASDGFLQGTWKHRFSGRSDTTLQLSYDHYERGDLLFEGRHTGNIDFQHHFLWGNRQDIVWGLGYQYSVSHAKSNGGLAFNPPSADYEMFSSFAQDEIALLPNRLYATLGAKVEHNEYTGFDLLPSAALAWMVTPNQTLWTSVSKAVRTPTEIGTAISAAIAAYVAPDGTQYVIDLQGNPHLLNEDTIAYEAGYRASVRRNLSMDLAIYYNRDAHEETDEPVTPYFNPNPPEIVLPFMYENLMYGEGHGLETFAKWNPTAHWTLSPGYAFEAIHMHLEPASHDTTSVSADEGSSPAQSAELRSDYAFPRGFSWNASAYFVDRVKNPVVPAYTRVDTSLTWHWREHLSLTAAGQNLASDRHLEYEDTLGITSSTLIKRGYYGKFTWKF